MIPLRGLHDAGWHGDELVSTCSYGTWPIINRPSAPFSGAVATFVCIGLMLSNSVHFLRLECAGEKPRAPVPSLGLPEESGLSAFVTRDLLAFTVHPGRHLKFCLHMMHTNP